MSAPRVSIVIPTRNGMATLPALFESLSHQELTPVDTVVVDSGSTDGSAEFARGRGARVVDIRDVDFDHGATRNLGIAHTSGDFIVLLVQDALPSASTCLASLVAPLLADATVAGSYARHVPRPDASALTRLYAERGSASGAVPVSEAIDADEFEHLGPMERLKRCTFDNVCSCIRRSIWEAHPFQPTTIAEDIEWAKEVLLAGYRIEFVPGAVVIHSHDRPARYELARTYLLHHRLFELLGLRTIPSVLALIRAIASCHWVHLRCESAALNESGRLRRLARAVALAWAWPLGQYVGGLSAARGWSAIRSRAV